MENVVKQFCSILSVGLNDGVEKKFSFVGEDLAQKSGAKEKSYTILNYIEEQGILEKVSFESRLFYVSILVWAEEFGILTRPELKVLSDKLLKEIVVFQENIDVNHYKYFFRTLDSSYVKAIFKPVENNLHKNDNLILLQGMQDFFNQTLLFYTRENDLNFSILPNTVGKFYSALKVEIDRQGELSFTMSDDDAIVLSYGQVYRIFLDSFADELFSKWYEIPKAITEQIKRKILLESNINVASKIIYRFSQLIKGDSALKKNLNAQVDKLKNADEDDADDIAAEISQKVFLILDELELAIYLQRYDEINRNQSTLMNEPTYKQVKKLLVSYKMEPHFTRYSIIKFFEFNPLVFLNRIDLAMFVREIALIAETLRSDRLEVPDNELRFFIDRILQQTRNLKDFARMASIFRANVKNYERHEILHNLMDEARMNNRIASALFSFYLGAMLEVEFGQNVPLPDIEEIANRLGSTFSITRRFNITQRIRQMLQRGEIDNTPVDRLLKQNLLALKLQHKMNEWELYFAFSQYLMLERFYPDIDVSDSNKREEKFEQLSKEVNQKIYKKIKEIYSEEFKENPEPLERYKILIFAENNVATLIGQDLDRRRREPELHKTSWKEIDSYIEMYVSDSIHVYSEQKKTKKINLADLYIAIQDHSTKISVTMAHLKSRLEQMVKENIKDADFDLMQNLQIIFGGIAIHQRNDKLNMEKIGFENFVEIMKTAPEEFHQLVLDSISGSYGKIEVKDPYGKTRTFEHERFQKAIEAIKALPRAACTEILSGVVQQDLFKEVYDALTSARNMAKNSGELASVLDDIEDKSAEILARAQKYYEEITAK